MESVIAACFLDGGLDAALQVVRTFILVEVPVTKLHNADYKTELQELVQQKKNQVLAYELVGQSGPDHDKQFSVEVSLNGTIIGKGIGSSKKGQSRTPPAVPSKIFFRRKRKMSKRRGCKAASFLRYCFAFSTNGKSSLR